MARQLPRLIDEYFLDMQAAVHGVYQPRATPRTEAGAASAVHAKLDSFSRRADQAMAHYREGKGR